LSRALLLLAGLAACSGAPLQSDWERAHLAEITPEDTVSPPRYPRRDDLVALDVPGSGDFRFFVDAATLTVGSDGTVRYVLVGRSPSGAQNVSFEGLRCDTREYRIYAIGHDGGRWDGTPAPWHTLRGSAVAPVRRALQRGYFCADARPVRDTQEALAALRSPRRSSNSFD
jgi:hypothetical protein